MAELITADEILAANKKLKYFGGKFVVKLFMRLIKLSKINKFYSAHSHLSVLDFNRAAFNSFGLKFNVSREDMEKIPTSGPYVIISNHPTGGAEALILTHIFLEHRSDFKFMANFLLTRIEPLKNHLLPVNPFEDRKEAFSSLGGVKNAMLHLKTGAGLGIFPAGEVSAYHKKRACITDKEWNPVILKMIKKANVPVIPLYVHAKNSPFFYFLGRIHPLLRTLRLPAEMLNKRKSTYEIKIGNPICAADLALLNGNDEFGEFLRFKTYSLIQRTHIVRQFLSQKDEEPVVQETSLELIEADLNNLNQDNVLCELEDYKVYIAPSSQIPHILGEIARLREITYRDVGEGTGKSKDTDHFDAYYHHLFIWDQNAHSIVGAYRMAKGKEVLASKGISGFYIKSLFEINEQFFSVLENTIELGRSFIRKEYQKKPLSLFLLWKGILYFLIKNPEYRYLLGPVSISNSFSDISKGIVLEFLKKNFTHNELTNHIKPKMPFNPVFPDYCNISKLLEYTGNDVAKLDKIIHDIEPEHKIPVLLKKYLKQNAKVLSANVDPNFNYCLDILMLLDINDVPQEVIESLSKEISEATIRKD